MKTREELFQEYRETLRLMPKLTSNSQIKKQLAKLHNLERQIKDLLLSKETIKEINTKLNDASREVGNEFHEN